MSDIRLGEYRTTVHKPPGLLFELDGVAVIYFLAQFGMDYFTAIYFVNYVKEFLVLRGWY